MRAAIAVAGSSINPASARSSRLTRMRADARLATSGSGSKNVTCRPARANTTAQARPIKPAPTMAIFSMSRRSGERLHAAAYAERLAGDVLAIGRAQKQRHGGDVFGAHRAPERHLR